MDAAVLGAFQVAETGDLANWKLPGLRGGNVGGAMDIAVGAREVFAMMTHATRDGVYAEIHEFLERMRRQGAVGLEG